MKKRVISTLLVLTVLAAQITYSFSAGIGSFRYADTQPLAGNLTYTNTVAWRDDLGREETYALSLNPGGEAYAAVAFGGSIYGRMDVAEVVAEAEADGKNVLAIMNADFFSLQTGVPLGIVIDDYIYKSSPEEGNAAIFRSDGSMLIKSNPVVNMTLSTAFGGDITVTHLNKARHPYGGMYILTEEFANGMTATTDNGWFVRLRIIAGEMRLGGTMLLEVEDVFTAEGDVEVGENCILLTASGMPSADFYRFYTGDIVTLDIKCDDFDMLSARYAVGGGDLLIENGIITDFETWDKPLLVRSPKTALGYKADGTIIALAVDGRNEKYANGLTLQELAEELQALGCVAAINLDGGGSTIVGVRKPGDDTAVYVNRPADGKPRTCSTYLIFITDGKRDGTPKHLGLVNSGTPVLSGSSVDLHAIAMDSSRYKTMISPGDVVFTSSRGGLIDNMTYYAGWEQGADRVTMYSPMYDIGGWGEIFVIANPTSVYFSDENGAAVTGLSVSGGSDVQLYPQATYHRLLLVSQPQSFVFAVEGDIGEVTPDGVLHVSNGGTGRITITAGEQSASIDVKVGYFDDMLGHWAAKYVHALYDYEIVKGVSGNSYEPETQMKRSDFVLMLYRAANSLVVPDEQEPLIENGDLEFSGETGGEVDGLDESDNSDYIDQTEPEVTSDFTEEEVAEATPEQTPEVTSEFTEEEIAEATPEVTEEQTPEVTPDLTPDITGEVTPEISPDITPDFTPEHSALTEPTPEIPPEPPFLDVAYDVYYFDAVVWAKEHGIAQGLGNGMFDPESPLTREQAFTFLYRALGILSIAYETVDISKITVFEDASNISGYAEEPTAVLVTMGVVEGADGKINPNGILKRAEMAKLLYAIMDNARSFV